MRRGYGGGVTRCSITSLDDYDPEYDLRIGNPLAGPEIEYNHLFGYGGISWQSALSDTATTRFRCNDIGDSTGIVGTRSRGMEFVMGRGGAVRNNTINGEYMLVYVESSDTGIYPDLGDTDVSWGNNNFASPADSGYGIYLDDW